MKMREKMEEYLDGVLDAAGCSEMDAAMRRDPAVAALFDRTKAQRALRAAVYESHRPSAAETASQIARLHEACEAEELAPVGRIGARPWIRWSAGVAAALAVLIGSFAVGRSTAPPQIVVKEVMKTDYSVLTVDFSGDTRLHAFQTKDEAQAFITDYETRGGGIAVAELDDSGHM